MKHATIQQDLTVVKLQVPMKKGLYEGLKTRAKELGFDSVQAYVRFWATAETASHQSHPQLAATLDMPAPSLNHPNDQALRYLELLLATNPQEPPDVEGALEYVRKQLERVRGIRYLDSLLLHPKPCQK